MDAVANSVQSLNELTHLIIACAIEVHRTLGSGLLESAYRKCLAIELRRAGLKCEQNRKIPLTYKGERVGHGYQADIIVSGCVIVEIKAVDTLHPRFERQLLTYLRLGGCRVGLLLNFGEETLKKGIRRVINDSNKTSTEPTEGQRAQRDPANQK